MQPTLVLSAPHPGIMYINGRFAGEISAGQPLLRPIARQGPVYLEFRPLSPSCRELARKLVFSAGEPIRESAEDAQNLDVVIWPGSVTEIELAPEPCPGSTKRFHLAGHSFTLEADSLRLLCDGRMICTLPDGAEVPQYRQLPGGIALSGKCTGGSYLLTMDEALQKQTGLLRAQQLEIEADGRIRAVANPSDLVGHATLENWKLTPEGLMMVSSESAWAHGAPRWPKTPDETARAAVEAAIVGLDSEAESYLSPALRGSMDVSILRDKCDLCVEMKYAPPDSRPCVGLLRLEGDRFARVRPLYYRAAPSGGPQGPWQIESFEFA